MPTELITFFVPTVNFGWFFAASILFQKKKEKKKPDL